MSVTGALYWLFFLAAVALFVLIGETQSRTMTYLLAGVLIVMTGLIKLDHDRTRRPQSTSWSEELSRIRDDTADRARSLEAQMKGGADQLAKKMISLENELHELKALVAEKYAHRPGKPAKKPKQEKLPAVPEEEEF